MKFEKFLTYYTHHSEAIIQWLILSILLLSGLLIMRSLLRKPEESSAASAMLPMANVGPDGQPMPGVQVQVTGELQEALNKIMAQTAKLEAVAVGPMTPADAAQVDQQVQALKQDLQKREEELAQLKAAAPAGGAPGAGTEQASKDAADLQARVKELEGKLAEYEILEDDIADLSLYKEENTRLKGELEKLKTAALQGIPTGPEQPEPPADVLANFADAVGQMEAAAAGAPEPAPMDAPGPEDIVAEFAEAVSETAQSPAAEVAAPVAIPLPETGNPMADFESTVQLEKQAAPPVQAAADASPTPQAAPAAAQAEADDLFAEFASGDASGGASLDTDKMMAEMAALVSIQPTEGNALEEGIDTEKMALEATGLTKSS